MTVGDRADSYGADGGNLSLETRAALQIDPLNQTLVVSRVYGLGGKDFLAADATAFFEQAIDAARSRRVAEPFAYHGATAGRAGTGARPGLPPVRADETRGMARVTPNPSTGRLSVELAPIWKMTEVPNRMAPGHGACPGCGFFPTFHQISRVLEGDLVVLYQTGCAMVVTTGTEIAATPAALRSDRRLSSGCDGKSTVAARRLVRMSSSSACHTTSDAAAPNSALAASISAATEWLPSQRLHTHAVVGLRRCASSVSRS